MRRLELPIRVIGLSNQGIPIFNFLASIDKFSWGMDRGDNIVYSIELTEFPEKFWTFLGRDKDAAGNIWNYITKTTIKSKLEQVGLLVKDL